VALGLAEVGADVEPLGAVDDRQQRGEALPHLGDHRRLLLGGLGGELPEDEVTDHARAFRSRSASTRQMVCTRSSMSTTGISSAQASRSAGSSWLDCAANSAAGSSVSTSAITARASSQRWHPGLPRGSTRVGGTRPEYEA